MPVIRTFACDGCDRMFEATQAMNDPPPDCPFCDTVLEWTPKSFSIGTNKSRAIDVTQDILEKDFGLTNFRDNQREGDVAAIVPDQTATERAAEIRQLSEVAQAVGTPMNEQQANMATQFWGGGQIAQSIPASQLLANAKTGAQMADAEGHNPLKLLHQAGKKGLLGSRNGLPVNVIARARR